MRVFERQQFRSYYDQDSAACFSDLEFRRCSFTSCAISITTNPRLRSTVRNVQLIQCEIRGCAVDTAIVENVLVDGLKTHGLLQCWGAVFDRVTLRGRIGRVMISPMVATAMATKSEQQAFDEANAAFYSRVEWALDISEGQFEECDIRRVPARLIRRDPATQVVVTREQAMAGAWRKIDLSRTYWATALQGFLEEGDADTVLVAPKRSRHFKDLLTGLERLREAGVARPD